MKKKSLPTWLWLVLVVATWRLVLTIAVRIAAQVIPFRNDFLYVTLIGFKSHRWLESWPVLWSIFNFDGLHYLLIAANGYIDQGRFLPLWPWLIRTASQLANTVPFSLNELMVVALLSQVFLLLGLWAFWKLVRLDAPLNQSWWTVVALLSFPTSFFLTQAYTESLFLFLAVISFWAARRNNWWGSGLAASLAMITRLTGVIMVPSLLAEWWQAKPAKMKLATYFQKTKLQLLPLALSPLPLFGYAYFNYLKWGDWLYFIRAHSDLGNSRLANGLVFPLQTVVRYVSILHSLNPWLYEWWLALAELAAFGVGTGLLILLWLKPYRWSYKLFATLGFLLPILSGTFSGLPRYLLILFPLFLVIGEIKSQFWQTVYLTICWPLLMLAMMLFSRGYFIA